MLDGLVVVARHDDGFAVLLGKREKERSNRFGVSGVQIARWFVGKNQRRIIGQRARYSSPQLLGGLISDGSTYLRIFSAKLAAGLRTLITLSSRWFRNL